MKKGFTLVELIGVLVILAALFLIITPIVDKEIKDGRQDLYNKQIKSIELSAQNWLSENVFAKPLEGETITLTISQLKQDSFVDIDIKNPLTKKLFRNDMLVKINNQAGIINYEVLVDSGKNEEIFENMPLITLNGDVLTRLKLNETYKELGAVCKTNNILTDAVVSGTVDITKIGINTITYTCNSNKILRTVIVK
ncbi:MAG: DUF5011 domain-containing protein [Bacilli bacterium]